MSCQADFYTLPADACFEFVFACYDYGFHLCCLVLDDFPSDF